MKNEFWFENPVQVRVFDCIDEDGEAQFYNGIAFQDKVICACCGMVVDIDDLYDNADDDKFTGAVIEPYKTWVSFSEEIGEE